MNIYLDIIIGSPQAECAKFGVCEIRLLPTREYATFIPQHWRHVKASLRIDGSIADFHFPFSGMMAAARKMFFPESGFVVEARKDIPTDILSRAGCTEPMFIQTGIYAIEQDEKGYNIQMNLDIDSELINIRYHAISQRTKR